MLPAVLLPLLMAASTAQAAAVPSTPLSKVHRVYVDSFGDDPAGRQAQALMMDALTHSSGVVVTENKEKADAILKGIATEGSHQEFHKSGDSTIAGRVGIADTSSSTETVTEAKLSVRLVTPDGDVIWSCTRESKGGKYKGASADAADQVAKQLSRDLSR